MRAVVQRVTRASVVVDDDVVGEIGEGLLIFVAAGRNDITAPNAGSAGASEEPQGEPGGTAARCSARASALAEKVANLRIFPDAEGKSNLSLLDTGGAALVISQFTLYADCRRGRRPSFTDAGDPGPAEAVVEEFRLALERLGVPTAAGRFGAHMTVSLVNDGPYTIILDTEELARPRREADGRRPGAIPDRP
jgi:D-tyrosyl-tRNA(Tyr) deacylase